MQSSKGGPQSVQGQIASLAYDADAGAAFHDSTNTCSDTLFHNTPVHPSTNTWVDRMPRTLESAPIPTSPALPPTPSSLLPSQQLHAILSASESNPALTLQPTRTQPDALTLPGRHRGMYPSAESNGYHSRFYVHLRESREDGICGRKRR